jgi:hypothetical protein
LKIYDCFTFFNELDLLEIRLNELWDVVDYFVLAESNITHTGLFKPLYYETNQERFKPYAHKIRHIVVDDMPAGDDNNWFRENHQRRCLSKGLWDMEPDSLVITTDVDEVPRASAIEGIKHDKENHRWILFAPQYLYKFNYMRIKTTNGLDWQAGPSIIVTTGAKFTDPQTERSFTFPWIDLPRHTKFVPHGGWHWSSLGNNQHCIQKINSFVHTNENVPEVTENFDIDRFIRNKGSHHAPGQFFEIVSMDTYFPQYVLNNLSNFQSHIVPGLGVKTTDLYPLTYMHTYRT